MPEDIRIVERPIREAEYNVLQAAVGWWAVEKQAASGGLAQSLFPVCAMRNDRVIGCGRIVGDGGIYFHIQDVVVLPGFQGRGIGGRIMDHIMDWLNEHARPGAFVGLMAAQGVAPLYEKLRLPETTGGAPGHVPRLGMRDGWLAHSDRLTGLSQRGFGSNGFIGRASDSSGPSVTAVTPCRTNACKPLTSPWGETSALCKSWNAKCSTPCGRENNGT